MQTTVAYEMSQHDRMWNIEIYTIGFQKQIETQS